MKICVIYGTRPELIKTAPLIHALTADPECEPYVVNTGQHADVLREGEEWFDIVPQQRLDVRAHDGSLNGLTANIVSAMGTVLDRERPDITVVQGDTTTVCASALASINLRIPVAHLEAGLRSGQRWTPFPEELNRRVVSALASLHLTPTAQATAHLLRENIAPETVVECGNTVIDALNYTITKPVTFAPELTRFMQSHSDLVMITCHRRENWGDPLIHVAQTVRHLAQANPGVGFVWPVHPNPAISATIRPILADVPSVYLSEPLPYPQFSHLLHRCILALSDSGGVQEEAPTLRTPVLVMRDTTERPEGVAAGCALLVGCDEERIITAAQELLSSQSAREAMIVSDNPYGDGQAAARCVTALKALSDHVA